MAAHVLCLTSSGGIPIFVRKRGEGDVMTFSRVASLNGVHMFLKSQNINLEDTETENTAVVWKEYANSITLIAVANGTSKRILNKFLDSVFSSMILVTGFDEIKHLRNLERLKRDLRVCNPIIDKLLDCLDIGDKSNSRTDFIDMTNCILCPENHLLQTVLEGYMECLDSMYGCLLIHGCVAVATENWWNLDPIERKLLILAVTSENNTSARDLPVFLPKKSPSVAFRIVSVTLINGVEVVGLCGPNPELTEVERLAIQCWRGHLEILRAAEQSYPSNIPSNLRLEFSMLAFLVVNYKIGKFAFCRYSDETKTQNAGPNGCHILRTFYYETVGNFLAGGALDNSDNDDIKNSDEDEFVPSNEAYWCSEYHKCYAIRENDNIMCIVCSFVDPIPSTRKATEKILKTLLADKKICW